MNWRPTHPWEIVSETHAIWRFLPGPDGRQRYGLERRWPSGRVDTLDGYDTLREAKAAAEKDLTLRLVPTRAAA